MFADEDLDVGEGSLNVGVIWVGVVEDDMFGRVGEENVEKQCKDESEYDCS